MGKVGRELGNTPTVARESYVSPIVVDAYLEGRTLEDFRGGRTRGPRADVRGRACAPRLLRAASQRG
jgi:DNA topoisomerase IB